MSVRICGKLITTVIAECFNNTFHLLDRFHVVDHPDKAVDNVRCAEIKKLKEAGELTYLKKCCWIFLKKTIMAQASCTFT